MMLSFADPQMMLSFADPQMMLSLLEPQMMLVPQAEPHGWSVPPLTR